MANLSATLKSKSTLSPKKKYEVITEETEAIKSGNNDANVKSKLKISIAKITAAIGDLKIDAIAPADAQAISKLRVFLSIWSSLPKLELIAEADKIAGPNNPTEPPKPTVNGAVISGRYMFFLSTRPSLFDKEYNRDGIACPLGFFEMYFTNKYTSKIPIIGSIK
ncbi:hypothetical protein WPG_1004 [Winogradskyella sp. PG-2]|nr:hypothetical protein WPG_1004 [Winogradskyella sp. PG-2]